MDRLIKIVEKVILSFHNPILRVPMDFLLPSLNTSTVGICVILIIISCFILHRPVAAESKVVPEAKGGWPIIGHLLMLGGSTPPHITLGAMADKYGPLFTIRLGMHRALMVSSSETAKECFTTNDLDVSSRPKLLAMKHLGYNRAMFAFAPHGAYWREIRKITTLQLLSNHRLELLKHIRVSEVSSFLKQLYGFWSEEEKNISGQALVKDMKQWLGDLTLNVILRMVAGKRYASNAADDDDDDEKESQQILQKALREFFHLLGLFVLGDAIPFLRFLDLGGYEKAMKKVAKELDDILEKWLQEHKRKREFEEAPPQDFMDVMLTVLQDDNSVDFAGYDADTVHKSTALVYICTIEFLFLLITLK